MSRVLSPDEIEQILKHSVAGRLGLSGHGKPYVVPLCFFYNGDAVYFHGAREGRKVDCIRSNGRACFLVDRMDKLQKAEQPCKFNLAFQSVIVEGRIMVVEDEAEKLAALRGLAARYGGPGAASRLSARQTTSTAVFKLLIETRSGRGNP